MFYSFFNSLRRSWYSSFFSYSFNFSLWWAGATRSQILQVIFFCWILRGLVVWPRLGDCVSKSQGSLRVSSSWTDYSLCIYHLMVWSNFKFFLNSPWITLPTQSYLVLNPFCAKLLHLFIIWLIISSLSPYNLQLLFCWVISILS